MNISAILSITPGVTAIIGSGGKTTLIAVLAEELRNRGSVILCTSTKIFPSSIYPTLIDENSEAIARALGEYGVVCIGSPAMAGKLMQPKQSFRELSSLADFVLVEADGANHLPLKAHAPHEPVIPAESNQVVCVLGADGFGKPIAQVCHRPELYSTLCGAPETTPVTPELAARVLNQENLGTLLYINKVESDQDYLNARELVNYLHCPVIGGSLHRRDYRWLS